MAFLHWKPFAEEEERAILEAINLAESRTSGEIRVHVDKYCKNKPALKAANLFLRLKMHDTNDRNGVLIYVALEERKFSILGDEGIDQKVPENFWQSTVDLMSGHFKEGRMVEGLCAGIQESGIQLAKYFPVQNDDKNELPDDISYGS